MQIEIGKTYETNTGKKITFFMREKDECLKDSDFHDTWFAVGFDKRGVKWWFEQEDGVIYNANADDYEYWADDKECVKMVEPQSEALQVFERLINSGWVSTKTEMDKWKICSITSLKSVRGTPRGTGYASFEDLMAAPTVQNLVLTDFDLKDWQTRNAHTHDSAAQALGISRATYCRHLLKDRVPKWLALACKAIDTAA